MVTSTTQNTGHNLTGKTQKNGCAETTISKRYHDRNFCLTLLKCFQSAFFSQREIRIEGFSLPVKLDTLKRTFYYGANKEANGTFQINGFELCLLWNEEFNDAFEVQRIPFREITIVSFRKK